MSSSGLWHGKSRDAPAFIDLQWYRAQLGPPMRPVRYIYCMLVYNIVKYTLQQGWDLIDDLVNFFSVSDDNLDYIISATHLSYCAEHSVLIIMNSDVFAFVPGKKHNIIIHTM